MFITLENFVKYIEVGDLGPCMLCNKWGKKAEKRGEIGKIAVSEASLVVGRTTAWLASLADFYLFIFFAKTDFSLLFRQCGAWAQTNYRGWLCLQGSTAFGVSTGNGVYTVVPYRLSVTIPY